MLKLWLPLACGLLLLAGCEDHNTSPRDLTPPAAPRGLYSVTGDRGVRLYWLDNTEADVEGYRIYASPCASGDQCPYTRVGVTTGTSFAVTSLVNGTTRYFAVAAYDRYGNESDLSYEDVFDTPRPAGTGLLLTNYNDDPSRSGYDFSDFTVRPWDDEFTDIFFDDDGRVSQIRTPFTDIEIQDAGYASSLDAVDYAPGSGWSPTGAVEAIAGHCYVVWTYDDHYAKFRVTSVTPGRVIVDWAYQVDPGNRELRARPAPGAEGRVRRPLAGAPGGVPR